MRASALLATNMQRILVDLIDLHIQGKQAHWNIVGHDFHELHLQLDELVDAARDASDDVAERMRALYAVPDGRARTVADTSSLPEFPEGEIDTRAAVGFITLSIQQAVATIRDVHDAVDAEDPSTTDILHGIIDRLEKLEWMIGAETRTPGM